MAKPDLRGQLRKQIESAQPTFAPRAATPGTLPGNMPIPIGKPVVIKNPTEAEKAVLKQYGVRAGEPVPDNFHELLEAAVAQGQHDATDFDNIPLPVAADTPPLAMPMEQPIESLPSARQAQMRAVLESSRKQFSREAANADINPGLRSAVEAPEIELINDVKKDAPPKQSPNEEGKNEPTKVSDEFCNHCGYPAGQECPTEATDVDKSLFVAAFCGGQSFKKTYDLFNDQVQATFRSLSARESDVCYEQVSIDFVTNRIVDITDQFEHLMRYKLALQLVGFKSATNVHNLCESLAEWKEQLADAEWKPEVRGVEGQPELQRTDTAVRGVADYVFSAVLPTDSMVKVLSNLLSQFNRLNTRLEVNATNPNFYKASAAAT